MDLIIVGDIQTILKGHVTKSTLLPLNLNGLAYALGGAALAQKELSLGETIIYESIGHIFTPERSSEEKKTLEAAFLMGIEKRPKDPLLIKDKQTVEELYRKLLKSYPKGFVIVGTALFSKLSVAYLKLSPIYAEDINALHDKYWQQEELQNREVKLFGAVVTKPDPRAFYDNPGEKGASSLLSHTHVLCPLARHLLTQSELVSGSFHIEGIDNITEVKNFR